MARKKELCKAANGLFMRSIGWKATATGGYAQHKFYLGRDEDAARLAGLRLEKLWEEVCARWEREQVEVTASSAVSGRQFIFDGETFCEVPASLPISGRPVWDETTLAIAEAVRLGESVARVSLPLPFSVMVPESPLIAHWFDQLQNDITIIKIELRILEAQVSTEESLRKEGERLMEMGRRMAVKAIGGQTLHAALDAYATWISSRYVGVDRKPTHWAGAQVRQITFLRTHLLDGPLGELDAERIDAHLEVLRLRPECQVGGSCSATWARNCLKQFRHFLRWLTRKSEFGWKRPPDLDFTTLPIPLTHQEKALPGSPAQVATYTLDELKTLHEYATPLQRLFMLLALNCGFGRAELASLNASEVYLRSPHPHATLVGIPASAADSWILRIRQKTGVYGEWGLWPETVVAIDWWLRQRASIEVGAGVDTLLVTGTGQRYDTPTRGNHPNYQIPNSWFALTERIRKDDLEFRKLSFTKLRKTAGNLIRKVAGGEVAGVFLSHGTPVPADRLLDVYTNRPFAKVFEALDRVGEQLRPVFATVALPFPEKLSRGGPNISRSKIRQIQELKREGLKTGAIAKRVGVSPETVRRWADSEQPQSE
jgi:hypothetical protein